MKIPVDNHIDKLGDTLEQRFPARPALVAWVCVCVEAKASQTSTALGFEDTLRGLAENDGCVDFQEWIEAASQALDDVFLQEYASDAAFVEKGCARIRSRQKNLYPWRTHNLDEHRPAYLEGDDVDFPRHGDD